MYEYTYLFRDFLVPPYIHVHTYVYIHNEHTCTHVCTCIVHVHIYMYLFRNLVPLLASSCFENHEAYVHMYMYT